MQRFSRLDQTQIAKIPSIHFDHSLTVIEAAKQGQGVVIVSPILVADDVAAGILIELFDCRLPLNTGYFVVHPRQSVLRKPAENLKAWLIAEAFGVSR